MQSFNKICLFEKRKQLPKNKMKCFKTAPESLAFLLFKIIHNPTLRSNMVKSFELRNTPTRSHHKHVK